jgi:hypothetical protein
MYWHGIDLEWAYSDLLNQIIRKTTCVHRARYVLHDAIVFLHYHNTLVGKKSSKLI